MFIESMPGPVAVNDSPCPKLACYATTLAAAERRPLLLVTLAAMGSVSYSVTERACHPKLPPSKKFSIDTRKINRA